MQKMYNSSEILQFAIRIEENGEQFYRLEAKKIDNQEIKALFNFLAEEEVKHRQIFMEMASGVENYEPEQAFPQEYFLYLRSYADGHVFARENEAANAATRINNVKEALEFAIERELDSILYYLEAKNLIPEKQKGAIDRIIEEERRHYVKLSDMKKNLS